jgi:8-oxo-dGTP diphosphatase
MEYSAHEQCNRTSHQKGIPHAGALPLLLMTERSSVVRCVGGVCHNSDGRLLLVQRANEPGRGRWSIPGGRVEPGEDDATALIREMQEETGLAVEPGPLVGRVQRGPYDIGDYRCRIVDGTLRAGSDALDARWFSAAELRQLPLVEELLVTLAGWDVLPRT